MDHSLEAFIELVHPDDSDLVPQDLQNALANPAGTYAGDFRLRRKDGNYCWIGSSGRVIFGDDGRPVHLVGAQLHVSDRVADKQKVQDTEHTAEHTLERLARLAENVPGGIFEFLMTVDGEMSLPYLSEGFADLVCQSVVAIQADANVAFEHAVPEDAARFFAKIEEPATTLKEFKETYRLVHPDRGLQYLMANSTPMREPDGGTRWYGSLMDVTEEILRQHALENERARTQEQALRDALTDLPNRRAFDQCI